MSLVTNDTKPCLETTVVSGVIALRRPPVSLHFLEHLVVRPGLGRLRSRLGAGIKTMRVQRGELLVTEVIEVTAV